MKKTTLGVAVALSGAAAFASILGAAGAALADPTGPPTYRQLAGVGSDTTQDVMNAMAASILVGGNKVIGSFDATGSSTITTKDPSTSPACSGINRPNGSGAGRTALLNSLAAGNGCIDFSRSSSLDISPSTPGLTYIPFGIDSISYAVTGTSVVPRKLTTAQLKAYYTCDSSVVGTGPNYDVTPILPQAGSGTRKFWEALMGITDANVNANVYPCIINGTKNGQTIEEHSGTALDDKSLVPFSIGQFNTQATQTVADKRGRAVLGSIDGTIPQLTNGSFSVRRDVYNVIPTSKVGVSPWSDVFVGSGSAVCTNTSVITKYGFSLNPNCGDTSAHS